MTPEDVIDILTAIAVTDRRTVSGNEVTMWHKIIGDLPKDLSRCRPSSTTSANDLASGLNRGTSSPACALSGKTGRCAATA